MPAVVASILLRCFSTDPEERPTMRGLAVALAAAIPATEHAPSGSEILRELVPRWRVSGQFAGRDVLQENAELAPSAAQAWPPLAAAFPRAPDSAATPQRAVIAAAAPAEAARSTTPDRPRAAVAGGARAPYLGATLPSGFSSGKFAAPQAARPSVPSIVAASELALPAGTPGPQPYAHAQLPAVMVSSQILVASPAARAPSGGGRRWLLAAVACAFVASFVVVHRVRSARQPAATVATTGAALTREPGTANHADALAQAAGSFVAPAHPLAVPALPAAPASPVAVPAAPASPVAVPAAPATPVAVPVAPARVEASASAMPPPSPPQPAPRPVPARAVAAVPSAKGELAIIVRPWAAIWVNGKSIPDGTPYRAQLPAGRYRVRIANDDLARDENLTVNVSVSKTTMVEREW